MGYRSRLLKPLAKTFASKLARDSQNAVSNQKKILHQIVRKARSTQFGRDHRFEQIHTYADFKMAVPLRDYEAIKPYVDKIIWGGKDVLWPGFPLYFAKTSGTTSGAKFIPVSKDSISNHVNGARNALLNYANKTGNAAYADGKMIFLSGSPSLHTTGEIPTGRLSGIVNLHVPSLVQKNQLPSYHTNCISDWSSKLNAIIGETVDQDMRLISGIPPWIQMYFDRIQETEQKPIGEVFPNLSLIVHGGVNFAPYEAKLRESVGRDIDLLELYPASEGFFAFDDFEAEGLLLNTNSGIFYEFVDMNEIGKSKPQRLSLSQVELGKDYAIVISSNAGLWGYVVGDTVRFTTLEPYRIKVTGRIAHFISTFGEHVIDKEVCEAIQRACATASEQVLEFTVAPNMGSETERPCHEWYIEFAEEPRDLDTFAQYLDRALCEQNAYYYDLIKGDTLQTLKIKAVPRGTFHAYMESIGKLGGQNKVPHLADNRKIADALSKLLTELPKD